MKKVTTQIVYLPRTATPAPPTFKAVLIDNARYILDSQKVYTYAAADFSSDDEAILLASGIKADLSSLTAVLTIEGKVKSGDTAINLLVNAVDEESSTTEMGDNTVNIGFIADGEALTAYEWAFGLPVLAGPITVQHVDGDYGHVDITDGDETLDYYIAAKVNGAWVMAPLTYDAGGGYWRVLSDLIPDGLYDAGDCMIYEDIFGINSLAPQPVSIYLTINEESTDMDLRCQLIEITNYGQIAELFGLAAMETRGNIAYSAAQFFLLSGGVKTFYIAPMTSEDYIADLIEELKTHDDTYYLIYNMGTYTEDKDAADALFAHVKTISAPLYKRERRLYVKEAMVGETALVVQAEQAAIINSALSLDNERVSLVIDYGETDSLIKYCAQRYAVNRDYSLTYEYIDIGNIWEQVSNLTDTEKEELKDNGVVAFDQDAPTSIPYVMYQTTTYIESDILAKKEENIQIAIDEVCRVIRQVLAPRIARGMDNKVTTDPNSISSQAYLANLNSDISAVRRAYESSFSSLTVLGAEIDESDPRHVRLRILAVPYYNVNRIDVYIYI